MQLPPIFNLFILWRQWEAIFAPMAHCRRHNRRQFLHACLCLPLATASVAVGSAALDEREISNFLSIIIKILQYLILPPIVSPKFFFFH
jgi:hypothetical protein